MLIYVCISFRNIQHRRDIPLDPTDLCWDGMLVIIMNN